MRVRAISDGTFPDPQIGECFRSAGDVFEIPDEPFYLKDSNGEKIPVMEMVRTKEGIQVEQQKVDKKGALVWKTGTWFTDTWMEKVSASEPLTPIEKQPMRTVIDVLNAKERKQPKTFSELTGVI